MRHQFSVVLLAIASTLLFSACSKHQDNIAPAPQPSAATMPDVGHVSAQKVSTQGIGDTEEEALMQALKNAVMEINGTSISMANLSVKDNAEAHLQANNSEGDSASADAYMQSKEFVQAVAQTSDGVIDHFTITKVDKPGVFKKQYTVNIDAYINKYHTAQASSKKLKIVVSPVRVAQGTYDIGGMQVSSNDLSSQITQRITNALVQTGRFDVLNRSENPEIDQELNLISSGQTDKQNLAKLNQTIPADVILVGSVDGLAYTKHSRALAISDQPLVSYNGHWAFSDKIINVTTRETLNTAQFSGDFPDVAPTTMPVNVDSQDLLTKALDTIVNDAVTQVVREIYPVTVVSAQGGEVVLSQGGSSVQSGQIYQLMKAGQAINDPQTGQVIGHVKMPIATIMIDRVDDKLSYGHLVSGTLSALATDGSVRLDKMLIAQSEPPPKPSQQSKDLEPVRPSSVDATQHAAQESKAHAHSVPHHGSTIPSKTDSQNSDQKSSKASASQDPNW